MKVAWYSPLPPSTSRVARYSALLVPALRERGVEVVAARGKRRWRGEPETDIAVYQIADDPAEHAWIFELLLRRPGLVVLHDFSLHRLVAGVTLERGDRDGYLRALERDSGLTGRMLGYAVADGRIPPLWEAHSQRFPLAAEILDRADGVIVHSRALEARVRAAAFMGRIWRVPWPAPLADGATGAGGEILADEVQSVDRVADEYVSALEQAAGGEAVLGSVLHELAQAVADVGLADDRRELRELAARMRELGFS
ncbi:MAG: hypothetical protein ACXVY3_08705 [Gaiellaceae bacterium]